MADLVIYCRVSTRGQSHAAQLEAARRVHPGAVEVLEVGCGAGPLPLLERLVSDAEQGKIGGVVVASLDRAGRDLADLLSRVARLRAAGARLVSLREGIDTAAGGGPMTSALIAVVGLVGELERAWISDRTKAGQAAARARGRTLGRPRASISRPAVEELQRQGWSTRRIARELGTSEATLRRRLREDAGDG